MAIIERVRGKITKAQKESK